MFERDANSWCLAVVHKLECRPNVQHMNTHVLKSHKQWIALHDAFIVSFSFRSFPFFAFSLFQSHSLHISASAILSFCFRFSRYVYFSFIFDTVHWCITPKVLNVYGLCIHIPL